jgi:endo-1,4-beta-xylanase
MNRREFLAGSAAILASGAFPALANAGASMKDKASAKGLLYGCAVGSPNLKKDLPFAEAVSQDAAILVHEYELKRKNVQPKPKGFSFSGADHVMAFAQRNNLKVRGHTLCWYAANPDWLQGALESTAMPAREKLLTDYIDIVVRRYAGRMHSWDVVNEAVEPGDWQWDGMRSSSMWYQAFGENYIALAFDAARAADPNTPLYLNDYSIENNVRWNETRRVAILKLLDRLKAKNVPIDGFGIQGHLKPYRDSFDQEVFAKFLKELEGYDLKLMITEFDVADIQGPADPAKRDAEIAAVTKSFLDVALASPAMTGVLTWGLSDRYSWLSSYPDYKWPDGQLSRVLPYDGNMVRKPMWQAMADAFDAAPVR